MLFFYTRLVQGTVQPLKSDGLFAHTRLSVCTPYDADPILLEKWIF